MNQYYKPETFAFFAAGILAVYCSFVLVLLAVLGPLGLNFIPYRTSPGMLQHIRAQDLVNAGLAAPLCLTGGILLLKRKPAAGEWVILPGLYLLYTGLVYGAGNEWSHPLYSTANSSTGKYAWLFLSMMTGGLFLAVTGFTLLRRRIAPAFSGKQRWLFIAPAAACLLFFSGLWIADIYQVTTRGAALFTAAYAETPTAFWLIKCLDLGIVLPAGFFALYLFAVKPQQAYPVLMLLSGFFMLMLTATVLAQIISRAFFQYYTLVLILLTLSSYAGCIFLLCCRPGPVSGNSPRAAACQGKDFREN